MASNSMKASELVDLLNKRYDPTTAEIWDRVGVVCGDLNNQVKKIYFCVDILPATVSEAIAWNADFIIAHHPLLLHELVEVADGEPPIVIAPWKVALKERLISEGIVLLTAHTNADKATPGVSDALARALGITNLTSLPGDIGRVGTLPEAISLKYFAAKVKSLLPISKAGIRVFGNPEQIINRIAVSGGSGDHLLAEVRSADVDLYLTADLRHHPVSEAIESGSPALIDAGHFATEWPWLNQAATLLAQDLASGGYASVEMKISTLSTDPWSFS